MNSQVSHPAMFWQETEHGAVQCLLCPRRCTMREGSSGFCRIRRNEDGRLVLPYYGLVSSIALDPIEKKPLYRFHPGSRILSLGGIGCNMRCGFCQNFEISQDYDSLLPSLEHLSPQRVGALAGEMTSKGNIGVAYTYNEPLIGYEYVYDCACVIREAGLKNVLVTNGCVNRVPLEKLLPLTDAMNIDLKGFSDRFYQELNGDLKTVQQTIALASAACHIEITTLVIPGENEEDVEGIARWIASVDPEIPLHLTRFFPRYMYADRQPTPRETIYRLREKAGKFLKHVFVGNMA